ncbi:MAG: hypothetical protein PHE49_05180 [bacterium]|nr:hypothetical protein [bacterium]
MKKHSFLIFKCLFVVLFLLPVYSSAFIITAVKAGSGDPPMCIPIDTIRPGVDFGIRIVDETGGMATMTYALTTIKLDESVTSPTFGMWVNDSTNRIHPRIDTVTAGYSTTDDAFYRFAWNDQSYMCPFKDVWIKIVMNTADTSAALDTSKPILALASPIDSGRYLITANPNPMGAAGPTEIAIFGPKPAGPREYDIKIFDTFGYLVKDLLPDIQHLADGGSGDRYMYVKWDGTTKGGTRKVANGVYLICVKIFETGKEAGIWKKKIGVAW